MRRAAAALVVVVIAAAVVVIAALSGGTPAARVEGDIRIVALSPALAVTLVDLGMEDQIVGRHGWDYVLDPALPVCGDQSGLDFEALLLTEPTHVLLEWGSQAPPARLLSLAEERGWVIENFSMLTLEETAQSVVTLSSLFDVSPRRDELTGATNADELLDRMIPRREPVYEGRVLLMWPTNPPAAVGPGSFHHEVLLRVGGRPAIEEGAAYIELDAEGIIELAPDAIVLISPREVGEAARTYAWEEIKGKLGVAAALDVPAVRDRRVVVIDDPLVLTPSTAMIDFGRELRAALEVFGGGGAADGE